MGRSRILNLRTSNLQKQMSQMRKLLGLWPNSRKRRDFIDRELNPATAVSKAGAPEFLSQTDGVRTKHITRRQIVLNRHFTEILSDVLANEFKADIDNLGISITSIETKAWNKGVSIFYSQDKPFDEGTHKSLQALIVHLRAAITERQLIGRTPHVSFIYDESAALERTLSGTLDTISYKVDEPETSVTTTQAQQLYFSKDIGSQEQKLISARFSAPADMNNNLLGVHYPSLYDEVALKLSRGRGQSSRVMSGTDLLADAKPLFKAPPEDRTEMDPGLRLLKMRQFLIQQRKKSEHLARVKRRDEIVSREAVKWLKEDDNDEGDVKVTPDVEDEAEAYYDENKT